jgi:hypothetical protein
LNSIDLQQTRGQNTLIDATKPALNFELNRLKIPSGLGSYMLAMGEEMAASILDCMKSRKPQGQNPNFTGKPKKSLNGLEAN